MTCFKRLFLLLSVCLLALSAGCGYRIGARGLAHPQIKSAAVGDVQNNTIEPLVAGYMRMALAEAIQRDGGIKLKNLGSSDCIIYCKINRVSTSTARSTSYDGDQTYTPSEFSLSVRLGYTVIVPGRGTPLLQGDASGSTNYTFIGDPASSRSGALRLACYKAAQKIVQQLTEGW